MSTQLTDAPPLKRALKNRHIQLIALGGAIGTGLFLGASQTIANAGPSVLLGYAVCGLIAFFIMRQLGEMIVDEPVAGSFSYFADKYWHPLSGFITGWNYWFLYILVSMAELSALGIYIQYWWPTIPTWLSAAGFFILINLVNLTSVKIFGELEFSFAIIKIVAVISMIIFGGYLLISGHAGPQATITNLWQHGGFFPHGFAALLFSLAVIMFSFGGLELVGITAAEAEQPQQTIPKAINQTLYRILIFYIGALAVLLSLSPWDQITQQGSVFVLVFHQLNDYGVATALNIIVLTAALSVYNSGVYCNSRMLFGLAVQGNAPKALAYTNQRGVPVKALAVSACASAFCVLLNYLLGSQAFILLMALAVSIQLIHWMMICITHLRFRRHKKRLSATSQFKSLGYPLTNWICLAFIIMIWVILYLTPESRLSVLLLPCWLLLLLISYKCKQQYQAKLANQR